jgi:hypothetical protein
MDPFLVLGNTIVEQATRRPFVVGAGGSGFGGSSGFDSSFLINAAAELAQRGVNQYESSEQDKKTQAATIVQLNKAIAADAQWAGAEAMLDLANQSKDPSRVAPAQALQMAAMSSAMSVGAGLSGDAASKRAASAQDAANKAAQEALASPKDSLKQATMRGWQKVMASAISSGAMVPGAHGGPGKFGGAGGGNWLTAKFGPMPVWGWGLTAVGVVVVGTLVVKSLRR